MTGQNVKLTQRKQKKMKTDFNPNILTFKIHWTAHDKNTHDQMTQGNTNFYVSNNADYKDELKRQAIGYFQWYEKFTSLQIEIISIEKITSDIEIRLSSKFN